MSQICGQNKHDKAPNFGEAREVHLDSPQELKSILWRKSERCPDPDGRVDKNTNHEFPDKIVAM